MKNLTFAYLSENGGIFDLFYEWNCEYESNDCKPTLNVAFSEERYYENPLQKLLHFSYDNVRNIDDQTREYEFVIGIKFRIHSKGVIKKFSIYNLLIQVHLFLHFLFS